MTDEQIRRAHLRLILSTRRHAMQQDVRGRIRDGRTHNAGAAGDELEHSDDAVQGELELALLGMRAQAVSRADEALARIDAGAYSACAECAGRIEARRRKALPFAVRCRACEAKREQEMAEAPRPGRGGRLSEGARS